MTKKTKNRSSRQTKQARQTANRARRNQPTAGAIRPLEVMGALPATHADLVRAFGAAWDRETIRMCGPDGQIREVSIGQIAEHINAELIGDGEPATDMAEIKFIASEDIYHGELWLRPDGVWETVVDYGSDA
jgi:hypothetical protein